MTAYTLLNGILNMRGIQDHRCLDPQCPITVARNYLTANPQDAHPALLAEVNTLAAIVVNVGKAIIPIQPATGDKFLTTNSVPLTDTAIVDLANRAAQYLPILEKQSDPTSAPACPTEPSGPAADSSSQSSAASPTPEMERSNHNPEATQKKGGNGAAKNRRARTADTSASSAATQP